MNRTLTVVMICLSLFAGTYLGASNAVAGTYSASATVSARLKALETKVAALQKEVGPNARVRDFENDPATKKTRLTLLEEQLDKIIDMGADTPDGAADSLLKLSAAVESLDATVTKRFTKTDARIDGIEKSPAMSAATSLAPLADKVVVDMGMLGGLAGPHVIFRGVNVHVQNGSGRTDGATPANKGGGNLILGYNEGRRAKETDPFENPPRTGTHSLVLGTGNSWTSFSAIVNGGDNSVTGPRSSIMSGNKNTVAAPACAVVSGYENTIFASGFQNAILGGTANQIENGWQSIIAGGYDNKLTAKNSVNAILSGTSNKILACWGGSISGGHSNVINSTGNNHSITGGGSNEILTSGHNCSISGGGANQVLSTASEAAIGGGWLVKATANGSFQP